LYMADTNPQPVNPTPTGSSSVIVKNVAPTVEPPTHKVLSDFFSFCGNISSLAITLVPGDDTVVNAVVTFENEAAAKTAVLLNNALINDRAITVELAPPDFQVPLSSIAASDLPHNNLPSDRSESSVVSSMLDAGYKLSSDALAQAKAFDEQHGLSQSLSNGFAVVAAKVDELDQSWQISTKAKAVGDTIAGKAAEVDQEYQIREKAGEASGQAINFISQTATTIATGATTAAGSVANFVNTNPQVHQGVETVKAVGAAVGQSVADAWNILITGSSAPSDNPLI